MVNSSQAVTDKSNINITKSLAIWLRKIAAIEATNFTADYAMTAEYYHYAGIYCRKSFESA